jgi:hypothetical protein
MHSKVLYLFYSKLKHLSVISTVKHCRTHSKIPYLKKTINYVALWENVGGERVSGSLHILKHALKEAILVGPVSENAVPPQNTVIYCIFGFLQILS